MICAAALSLSKVISRNAFKTVEAGCSSASFLGDDFFVALTGDRSETFLLLSLLFTASFNSSSAAIFATTAFHRSNSGTAFERFSASYKLSNFSSFPLFLASSSNRRRELSETPLVTENSETMFARTAADVSAYRLFFLLPSFSSVSCSSSCSSSSKIPNCEHISSTCGWIKNFAPKTPPPSPLPKLVVVLVP